jgi:DNA-cytosine methyltransferase
MQMANAFRMAPPPGEDKNPNLDAPATKVRIAGDCSGLESLSFACQMIGLKYNLVFCSEKDKHVRAILQATHKPEVLYEDVTTRCHASAPKCDIYTAGFPCQPFSNMGKMLGPLDKRGRIIEHTIEYIRCHRPDVFILENVVGLVTQHKQFFDHILTELRCVKSEQGQPHYHVDWKILNARDHGLAQCRQRVWIVGLNASKMSPQDPFQWPEALAPVTARRFLNNDDCPKGLPNTDNMKKKLEVALGRILDQGGDPDKEDWFVDIHASPTYGTSIKKDETGCLTKTRASGHGPWNTRLGRFLRASEMARLQGFKISQLKWKGVASEFQLCGALGNAWSVNVAARVLLNCCRAIQLKCEGLQDPFARRISASSISGGRGLATGRAGTSRRTMKMALKRPAAARARGKSRPL